MSHLKFLHEIDSDSRHRIIETVSNTIGFWADYFMPAFLDIDDRTFCILNSGKKEHVFEMIYHETETKKYISPFEPPLKKSKKTKRL